MQKNDRRTAEDAGIFFNKMTAFFFGNPLPFATVGIGVCIV
jgi:hypothetical protein